MPCLPDVTWFVQSSFVAPTLWPDAVAVMDGDWEPLRPMGFHAVSIRVKQCAVCDVCEGRSQHQHQKKVAACWVDVR